jgi:uncharacterized protein YdhG (YjbR/CyaY superfamily)
MSLFAIGDLHLSLGEDKPMDVFSGWNDYVQRLEENWKKLVRDDDTVVLAGDISWAMKLEETVTDFKFIDSLPGTTEKISWSMPTYWKGCNIIHFAAQKKHIGLYPGPEAVAFFSEKLDQAGLKYSKGAIQIPYSGELPLALIAEIARWCMENAQTG